MFIGKRLIGQRRAASRWAAGAIIVSAWLALAGFPGAAQEQADSGPEIVTIGAYLNDVQSIDLRNHNYLVDFYLWFRGTNPEIDPSNTMEFVNHSESWGTIITKSTEEPEVLADGQFYQSMHVQGRMSRKLDLRNYPFDRQNIVIDIEDAVFDTAGLKYEIDSIGVNPALKLPGFQFEPPIMRAADYTHPTNFGDPRLTEGGTYSRVTIDMPIARPTINAIVKNVLPVLLTTICASFVFLLHPSLVDSRFQIAIFSIISIVALQITVGEDLPTIEYLTLLDTLYLLAYGYTIAVIGALVYATKLVREESGASAAIRVDRMGGGLLFGAYLIASGVAIGQGLIG